MTHTLANEGHAKILYAYLARLTEKDFESIAIARSEVSTASLNQGMRAQIAAQDQLNAAIQAAIAKLLAHDKELICRITMDAYGQLDPEAATRPPAADASVREPSKAAQHPDLVKPITRLKCCCCGGYTKGRQYFNQDLGYGLGTCCIDYVRSRVEDMQRTYGVDGVHYNVELQSQRSNPDTGAALEKSVVFQGIETGVDLKLTAYFIAPGEEMGHGYESRASVPKVILVGSSADGETRAVKSVSATTIRRIGTCRFEAVNGFVLSAHDAMQLAAWTGRHLSNLQS